MAMTIQEISKILDEVNFGHKLDEEDNMIISGGGTDENTLAFFINLLDDGETFQMDGRLLDDNKEMIKAKDHKYVAVLMVYLLQRNYETKFGTWEFNPEDGTVRVMVEIPLADNILTAAQLKRITEMMVSCSQEQGHIKHILATGELPKEETPAEMIATLEAMLAQLKASANGDDGI